MPAIGVIDDRAEVRRPMADLIAKRLEKDGVKWDVVDSEPLPAVRDYPGFITENDISVLIVDERLREQPGKSGRAAEYAGHDVISFLRMHLPSLPLFVVTAYEDDPDLQKRESDVEEIINRDEWVSKYATYVKRMVRRGRNYVDEFQGELTELAERSEKIATGIAKTDDRNRLKALQSKLSLAFPTDSIETRDAWLRRSESEVAKIEKLISKLQKKVKKK